ncbi:hypothetical protein OF83DRAFT_1177371 [Amylostereum chailletii]|nr:hypothetical protein OF83DRAFT_1177371 [Amylostereum chailletii]
MDRSSGVLAVGVNRDVHVAKEVVYNKFATYMHLPRPDTNDNTNVIPRSLHFIGDGSKLITMLERCNINASMADESQHRVTDINSYVLHSGATAISPDFKTLIVSDIEDTVQRFRLPQPKPIQTYFYQTFPEKNYPVTVSFLNNGQLVASGSPGGDVPLWDTDTGAHYQTLNHDGDIIQTIACRDTAKYSIIVMGNSQKGKGTRIIVWRAALGKGSNASWYNQVHAYLVLRLEDAVHALENEYQRFNPFFYVFVLLASAIAIYVYRESSWMLMSLSFLARLWNTISRFITSFVNTAWTSAKTNTTALKVWMCSALLDFLEINREL